MTQTVTALTPGDGLGACRGGTGRNGGRLALLAGLDAAARKEASRWLASYGFEVVPADDLPHALAAFAARHPAIVLAADVALRDEDGWGLCHALRQQPGGSGVPVLALCAAHREAGAVLQAGATDLLERPVDWQMAALRAERLVQLAESSAELKRLQVEMERLKESLEAERRDSEWRQHFDALTGLPDGERLEVVLERALVTATESSQVAVALFKIGHLVMVNTRLGRARTNSVLQQVAQRLVVGLRAEDRQRLAAGPAMSMAARMGGGLFAAMLTGLTGWQEAQATLTQLIERLSGPHLAGDEEVALSISVGVALAPADGLTAEALVSKTELAVREAAEHGVPIRFYGQTSYRVTERGRAIIRLLPGALARSDFRLHYQPLVVDQTRVSAAEALLRWDSPELGEVPPAEFIPLAEEAGLMVDLGNWVLRTACRQVRTWLEQGLRLSRIAVNVALCQLVRGDLARAVRAALSESGIEPSLLELELSERGVLRSDPEILRQLHEIRGLGVRLAIDDFGTGNSAVAYLKQFPVDVLKIDQSYTRGVVSSSEDAAIASATIAMARQLGLWVVAEGVEEQGQMDFLRGHGCDAYQGFLFSPAVPPEAFADMLRSGLVGASV